MKKIALAFTAVLWINAVVAQKLPFDFTAKKLLVLSDADMVSSAYIDGHLKTESGVADALTVINWGDSVAKIEDQRLHIPNSVTNWVDGMDIALDKKVAFVIDTKKSLPRSIQNVENVFTDLPDGSAVYAVAISDTEAPKLLDSIKVPGNPLAISVNPKTGNLLVICREKGKEINLIDWQGDSFGAIHTQSLEVGENAATHGSWHPDGKHFAVTLEPASEIQFYSLGKNNQIANMGQAVKAGTFAGAGKFSKNGAYYLVPDLKWDQGYNVKGNLLSIAFSEQGNHKVKATVEVGVSPEGFAISPDGKLIAVSNMGTNFMPMDFALFGQKASISLLAFDENEGRFTPLDEQAWAGILPEGIAFDADGDMLVLTSFDRLDLSHRSGYLSFWKVVENNGKTVLEPTGFEYGLTRGSHYVKLIGN
ncbi:lactonase family protein [Flavobacteriaceae bacterium GF1]